MTLNIMWFDVMQILFVSGNETRTVGLHAKAHGDREAAPGGRQDGPRGEEEAYPFQGGKGGDQKDVLEKAEASECVKIEKK